MKYAIWFVRLAFAAWMIPAGVNHFLPIFPQPMGSQPLSRELIIALIDSHLFDLVKAVELIAGVCVLVGFHARLAVVICMPVSFCVFYWDAPLEGWGSRAAQFGIATLLANVVLLMAYARSYRSMFVSGDGSWAATRIFLAGRVLFGAWMLVNAANYLFVSMWPVPAGHEPLAIQLMEALVHSGLLEVAMVIQLVAGALILAGVLVPAALCLVMPISVCALYWSLVLDHQPLGAALAFAALALNGLLMLACIDSYRGLLLRHGPAEGEAPEVGMNFNSLFANLRGRVARHHFLAALITLLAVVVFFQYLVTGRTARFCILVLMYPGVVLLTQRLRDMGRSAWLLAGPVILMLMAFAIWLGYLDLGEGMNAALPLVALVVAAGVTLWCSVAKGQAGRLRSPP